MYKIIRISLAISILFIVSVSFGAETLLQIQSLEEKLMPTGRLISLDDCVKFAIYNSFEVRLAKLDLYIAETDLMYSEAVYDTFLYGGIGYEEDKREQLSVFAPNDSQSNTYSIGLSKTLPTGTEVSAEYTDARHWDNSAFITQNPAHTSELTLEAKQPIMKNAFGYVDRNTITLTKLAVKNAGLEEKDRIEVLITDVTNAYWELVYAKKVLEINIGMLEKAENLHASNTRNFEMGIIEKVDLLASESNVALKQTNLLLAENSYNRAEKNLKLLMNLDDDEEIIVQADLSYPDLDRDLEYCLKESFNNRRDYQILKRDAKIKDIDLKIKDNEQLPEVDVTLGMAANGVDPKFKRAANTAFAVNHPDYYAGLEFSLPIENREARSQYNKAKYEKEKSILNIKDLERSIITQVGNDYRDVISYQASLVYIRKAVQLQSGKLKEEEKRFQYGRSNTKRLIDYQHDLLQAEMEDAVFSLRHIKARVALDRSMNVLLPKYEGML